MRSVSALIVPETPVRSRLGARRIGTGELGSSVGFDRFNNKTEELLSSRASQSRAAVQYWTALLSALTASPRRRQTLKTPTAPGCLLYMEGRNRCMNLASAQAGRARARRAQQHDSSRAGAHV